jgi:AbrB family looped-hinge helix DNA binding protein
MTKMTVKGQVTIPKRLRDYLGLKPGSEVEFVVNDDGRVALGSKEKRPRGRFDAIRGTLDLGMTTDEFVRFLRGDPTNDPPRHQRTRRCYRRDVPRLS